MKKTILTAMAAVALLLGGYANSFAQEPCCNPEPECYTAPCEAQEGFQTIGEGTQQAAEGSYNTVKEGTENAYQTVKEGTVNAYEKTKEGTENAYETVKEGTVNTYEKAKEGTVGLWEKTKEAIHNATE